MVVGKDDGLSIRDIEDRAGYDGSFVLVGYEAKNIKLGDISELVFAPLSQFLKHRKKKLENFGRGLGKLNAARCLFGWWPPSGIVRGFIVVGGEVIPVVLCAFPSTHLVLLAVPQQLRTVLRVGPCFVLLQRHSQTKWQNGYSAKQRNGNHGSCCYRAG
jgi:hypothetical protein